MATDDSDDETREDRTAPSDPDTPERPTDWTYRNGGRDDGTRRGTRGETAQQSMARLSERPSFGRRYGSNDYAGGQQAGRRYGSKPPTRTAETRTSANRPSERPPGQPKRSGGRDPSVEERTADSSPPKRTQPMREPSEPRDEPETSDESETSDDQQPPLYGGTFEGSSSRRRASERERAQREYERRTDRQWDRQRDLQRDKSGQGFRRGR
ncbi:hypothetical protein [Halorussus amylolyticus]|uniref:hypothetical protein n=1 Tax=Halorussus amylolyticus TaxID=1126242 RepID=UPI00104B412A|nr:hypothetical protein [Halorussus amylolyticus]